MSSEHKSDALLVATRDTTAYVRVVGRGSFSISTSLKRFCNGAMEKGCARFVLDMIKCESMDSTFMGVLAGIALRLKKSGSGGMVMINTSQRTDALLRILGLNQLIDSSQAGVATKLAVASQDAMSEVEKLDNGTEPSRRETAQTMLEAHEDLIEISTDNLPKFKDVITYLKEDLEEQDDLERGSN